MWTQEIQVHSSSNYGKRDKFQIRYKTEKTNIVQIAYNAKYIYRVGTESSNHNQIHCINSGKLYNEQRIDTPKYFTPQAQTKNLLQYIDTQTSLPLNLVT